MDNDSVCRIWSKKLRRMLHWGPLIVLPIIGFISFVTFTWSVRVVSPTATFYGLFRLLFLAVMLYTILRSYFCSLFIGPGFVPLKWSPSDPSVKSRLQFCRICQGFKPPRAHHCRTCQRCVMKMDHHCPWINTCCGHLNHCHFVTFVLSATVGCFGCSLMLGPIAYGIFKDLPSALFHDHPVARMVDLMIDLIVVTFALGLAVGVTLSVGTLAIYQLLSLKKNQTAIESWIVEKAQGRRTASTLKPFIFPYDLGWRDNLRQVLSLSGEAVGDGIYWPVRPGCGQYDLTLEQIKQKKMKILLRREYRVIVGYTGQRYPCSHFGCCTACHAPCPTEQLLVVNPGDVVLITRWSKYWLYGDLRPESAAHSSMTNGTATTSNVPNSRGWLPRKCVVEVPSRSSGTAESKLD